METSKKEFALENGRFTLRPKRDNRARLECMECGKKFKTGNFSDPECPNCGSTDLEVM